MNNYNIAYPVFRKQSDSTNDKEVTAAQVRVLSLAMAIESVVSFEQPRNGHNHREAHSSREFIERAKIFESYILGKHL